MLLQRSALQLLFVVQSLMHFFLFLHHCCSHLVLKILADAFQLCLCHSLDLLVVAVALIDGLLLQGVDRVLVGIIPGGLRLLKLAVCFPNLLLSSGAVSVSLGPQGLAHSLHLFQNVIVEFLAFGHQIFPQFALPLGILLLSGTCFALGLLLRGRIPLSPSMRIILLQLG